MADLNFVRKLTDEEQLSYLGAMTKALEIVPTFRDVIALMRPFYDSTCATAYTDRYSRVGLSDWFFTELSNRQRATVILHECMHVLNNHFIRAESIASNLADMRINVAQDFEINCGLRKLNQTDFEKGGIFPDEAPYFFEQFKSFEQYYHLLTEFDKNSPDDSNGGDSAGDESDGQDGDSSAESSESSSGGGGGAQQDGDSSGSGSSNDGADDKSDATDPANNSDNNKYGGCDNPSEDRSAAADDADIARASDTEQQIAKKNTAARIVEERKNSTTRGNAELHDFLELAQRQMSPPKVKWQSIFRRVISRSNDAVMRGKSDYSYKRVNRRAHDTEYIFPGMVQYVPKIMFGIDTSGSMAQSDYLALLSEAEGIMKSSSKQKNGLKVFSVDVSVKKVSPVNSVKDVKLQGGGGTDMSVAWAYVNSLNVKERPDIFILATDGGTNWNSVERELLLADKRYKSIILVTSKMGYDTVTESVHRLASVIDVSND